MEKAGAVVDIDGSIAEASANVDAAAGRVASAGTSVGKEALARHPFLRSLGSS